MTIILDPTDERVPTIRKSAPRDGQIRGPVALLDISKPKGDVFLDRVEALLSSRLPEAEIRRYVKPAFSKPAPDDLRREIQRDNAYVIEGLAD